MTILQRFEAVKNKELRSKLVKNYREAYANRTANSYKDDDGSALLNGFLWANSYKDDDGSALLNGFLWAKSPEAYDYWADLYFCDAKAEPTLDQLWIRLHGADLNDRIKQLESAIRKTIRENRHLADGNNCTLIHLKNVLKKPKSNK